MISDPQSDGQNEQKNRVPVPKTKITNEQIKAWGAQLSLPEKAVAQIMRMNGSDPVRVGSGIRSARGMFPSSIMGCMLNYESRTCEASYLWLRHAISRANPDRPKMILCQPCWLDIVRDPKGEKKTGFKYPPDFFELSDSWAGFIGCKWEDDLENTQNPDHEDYDPWRYQRLESGEWVSPPAEAAAQFYGLSHRIWPMSRRKTQLIANLQFLSQYFEPPTDNYLEETAERIRDLVKSEPGIQLRKIQSALSEAEVDTLFFCIANQDLHIDIENEPIAPNFTTRVFPNVECSDATRRMESLSVSASASTTATTEFVIAVGTEFTHGGILMVIVRCIVAENFIEIRDTASGKTLTMTFGQFEADVVSGVAKQTKAGAPIPSDASDAETKWRSVEPAEWIIMNRRFASVERFIDLQLRSRLAATDKPTRNQFRWIGKCREAGAKFGPGFEILGLQPEPKAGNTLPRDISGESGGGSNWWR